MFGSKHCDSQKGQPEDELSSDGAMGCFCCFDVYLVDTRLLVYDLPISVFVVLVVSLLLRTSA